jgi:AAA15 family ATPase/GTPase
MKIHNLKIAKFLSFGPEQNLNDFGYFNLFIGKNGSGKTNAFKILQGLDVDYEIIGSNIVDTSFKITVNVFTGTKAETIGINVYAPSMILKQYTNRDCHSSDVNGNLEINYQIKYDDVFHQKKIKFSDDPGGTIRFNEGDISIIFWE